MMRMLYIGGIAELKGKTALVQALTSEVVENDDGIERVTTALETVEPHVQVEAQFDDLQLPRQWTFGWNKFPRAHFGIPVCTANDHHWERERPADGERCKCGALSFPPLRVRT